MSEGEMTDCDRQVEISTEELMRLIGNRPVAVNVEVHGELVIPTGTQGAIIVNVRTIPLKDRCP